MSSKLKSRKFWIAVAGAIILVLTEGLGVDIPREAILSFIGILIAYILGEAYVDSRK